MKSLLKYLKGCSTPFRHFATKYGGKNGDLYASGVFLFL